MAKGKKFGRDLIRAVPEPLDGQLITNTYIATGPNEWCNLALQVERLASVPIEGVLIKALTAEATGFVWLVGPGREVVIIPPQVYQIGQYEAVSLHIDDLNKINLYIPAAGDGVTYVAIAKAVD